MYSEDRANDLVENSKQWVPQLKISSFHGLCSALRILPYLECKSNISVRKQCEIYFTRVPDEQCRHCVCMCVCASARTHTHIYI